MKVLVVSNGYPPRGGFGTEFYTRELVQGLRARGHDVAVLHPERSGARPRYELEPVDEGGVPIWLLHNPGDPSKRFESSYRDPGVERAFDALLARERPELVHFTYLLWGLSVGLPAVARARGIPSLATLTDHGLLCHRGQMFDASLRRCFGPHPPAVCARCIRRPTPFDHTPVERVVRRVAAGVLAAVGGAGRVVVARDLARREAAVRECLATLVRLIAPTAHLAGLFERAGTPRAKLLRLCYAFDEEPYRAVRSAPPPARTRFVFLGQFAPHKGLATLVAAARALDAADPRREWELVLHGGPSAGRHRRYAAEVLTGVDPRRIRVAAPFAPEQAPSVLAGFSALVAPSEWDENAPLAVLQARAAGLPVIASDVPGIAEVLPAANGRLCAVGDAPGLAEAMRAVVRGELARPVPAGLPVPFSYHLDSIEAVHREVRASARGLA